MGVIRSVGLPSPMHEAVNLKSAGNFYGWNIPKKILQKFEIDSAKSCRIDGAWTLPDSCTQIFPLIDKNDRANSILIVQAVPHRIGMGVLGSDTVRMISSENMRLDDVVVEAVDINGDGRTDALVAGKKSQGLLPFIQTSNGKLREGKLIEATLSVGAFTPVYLNDDQLVDIVAYDWVKSELHILYGVGGGRFLEQSIFPIQATVNRIWPGPRRRDGGRDFVLMDSEKLQLQVWRVNRLGEFREIKTLTTASRCRDIVFQDVNNDGLPEIVALTESGLIEVWYNEAIDPFVEHTRYSMGGTAARLLSGKFSQDKYASLLVFDSQRPMLNVLGNASERSLLGDSTDYAVGANPAELVFCKFRGSETPLLVSALPKDNVLGVFRCRPGEGPFGMSAVSVSANPQSLSYIGSSDSTILMIIGSKQQQTLTVASISHDVDFVQTAVIPTEGSSIPIGGRTHVAGGLTFCTLNADSLGIFQSVSNFSQIAASQFIEESFRLPSGFRLLGSTSVFANQRTPSGVVFLFRAGDSSTVEIGASSIDSSGWLPARTVAEIFLPRSSDPSWLYSVDIDGDDTLDLIIAANGGRGDLFVARGMSGGTYATPVLIESNVAITSRARCQVVDLDGDGFLDIVLASQQRGGVGVCRGKRGMKFDPWVVLSNSAPEPNFIIADVNGDNVQDLCISLTKEARIRIYNGLAIHKKK
ncbi:MAG: VCBS repeat-containing protein [Ignavibacteriales bacterium]|nr:VCBS repeat-containing protein [Ignavibacteriales bacterium]